MKALTSKSKLFIYMSIFAIILLSAALVWGFLGLNLSISYSGGSQLKVTCQEENEIDIVENKLKQIFNDNNIKIYETNKLTSGAEYQIVYLTKSKDISNEISLEIREVLKDIDSIEISGFDKFGSSYNTKTWVIILTIMGLGIITSLSAYAISKKWSNVISYAVSFITVILSSFALLILTRVEIGDQSLAGVFIGIFAESIITMLLLIRIANVRKKAEFADKSIQQICSYVRRRYVILDMFIYSIIMIGAIIAVATGTTETIYFGVALALSLMCTVFVSYYILIESNIAIEEAFIKRYNAKMNVLESVTDSLKEKSNKTKTKKERPKQQAIKDVKVNKKRKRRNKTDNKVIV